MLGRCLGRFRGVIRSTSDLTALCTVFFNDLRTREAQLRPQKPSKTVSWGVGLSIGIEPATAVQNTTAHHGLEVRRDDSWCDRYAALDQNPHRGPRPLQCPRSAEIVGDRFPCPGKQACGSMEDFTTPRLVPCWISRDRAHTASSAEALGALPLANPARWHSFDATVMRQSVSETSSVAQFHRSSFRSDWWWPRRNAVRRGCVWFSDFRLAICCRRVTPAAWLSR